MKLFYGNPSHRRLGTGCRNTCSPTNTIYFSLEHQVFTTGVFLRSLHCKHYIVITTEGKPTEAYPLGNFEFSAITTEGKPTVAYTIL